MHLEYIIKVELIYRLISSMYLFLRRRYTKDLVSKKYKKDIGDFTYGNVKIISFGEGAKLKIGKFCSIAPGLKIFLGGEHRTDWITTYPFPAMEFRSIWPEAQKIKGYPKTKGNVIIGNDVWIGRDVTILSGVTIGDGAVIGANSLVAKDIEPYSIVGGNPAKLIKKRFDNKTINKLLKISWWDWPIKKIKQNIHMLCNNDIKKFIKIHLNE